MKKKGTFSNNNILLKRQLLLPPYLATIGLVPASHDDPSHEHVSVVVADFLEGVGRYLDQRGLTKLHPTERTLLGQIDCTL